MEERTESERPASRPPRPGPLSAALASDVIPRHSVIQQAIAAVAKLAPTPSTRIAAWQQRFLTTPDALRRVQQVFSRQAEAMAKQMELFAAAADLMLELGWPPILEASVRQMNGLLSVRDEEGAAAARAYLEMLADHSYDDGTVQRKLEEWGRNPLLVRRMRFLRAGADAHVRGAYACSVPTLLTQAEGIILDCYEGVVELELAHVDALMGRLLQSSDDGDSIVAKVDGLVHEYYLRQVLKSVGRRDDVPEGLNRHCVLHGRDLDYDTKANSLRALILVDYLTTSLVIVSRGNSHVYHRAGCRVVLRSASAFVAHANTGEAIALGKRPCRVCRPPGR